jgi:hypothetical protein
VRLAERGGAPDAVAMVRSVLAGGYDVVGGNGVGSDDALAAGTTVSLVATGHCRIRSAWVCQQPGRLRTRNCHLSSQTMPAAARLY